MWEQLFPFLWLDSHQAALANAVGLVVILGALLAVWSLHLRLPWPNVIVAVGLAFGGFWGAAVLGAQLGIPWLDGRFSQGLYLPGAVPVMRIFFWTGLLFGARSAVRWLLKFRPQSAHHGFYVIGLTAWLAACAGLDSHGSVSAALGQLGWTIPILIIIQILLVPALIRKNPNPEPRDWAGPASFAVLISAALLLGWVRS